MDLGYTGLQIAAIYWDYFLFKVVNLAFIYYSE